MTHQRTMRQETMPAVIQTRKGVEKHIDTHRLTPQNWGVGPPEFSHQIESFLLCQTLSCFTARPQIYTGLFQTCLSTSAITCPFSPLF